MLLDEVKRISIRDYSYDLPENRIAKYPVSPRDSSKLLIYREGDISDTRFRQLADHLQPGSMLVYNNTKVIHARLYFHKDSGAQIEIFCLEPFTPADYAQNFQAKSSCEWLCIVGNLKKWKSGALTLDFEYEGHPFRMSVDYLGMSDKLNRVRFSWQPLGDAGAALPTFGELLQSIGQIPIPPYLNRKSEASDEVTYQTVYSRVEGSVAAPTAGLHFTPEVLSDVDARGVERREVTLHVSASTFAPVKSEHMSGHPMHLEFISVGRQLIEELITHEGKITAVGTTSVRTLESLYWFGLHYLDECQENEAQETPDEMENLAGNSWVLDQWYPYRKHREVTLREAMEALLRRLDETGEEVFNACTRLLIAPGYRFRVVNAMLTNFHQPQSTLLLLVSAFVGEDWRKIYNYALTHDFRFLSYGDSSLLHRCDR